MRAFVFRVAGCAFVLAGVVPMAGAAPLSSAITYQGELFDGGVPAVGSYDLRFTPYADASNPTLLGPPVVVEDVLVSAGVFTTQVDFGPGFFVGDAVFLELAVRPFDSVDPDAFERLDPRQEITAAPYALRPAPGSVTDLELAGDAVGGPQLADGSVASADLADGSIAPQDLAVATGAFDTTFWRVGGNTGTGGTGLGTLDNEPLALFSPIGVTVNGGRYNNSTELTIRSNSLPGDNNADLTLWPRASTAFFDLAVTGTVPGDTQLGIYAVGTTPFTGYDVRALMNFDGALGLGGSDPTPHARLHVTGVDLGFDAVDSSEALELLIEDNDAQIGLYSSEGGQAGSVIGLGELDPAGAFVNQWGLFRRTTPGNAALQWSFGTNNAAAANPVLHQFGIDGSVAHGTAATLPSSSSFVFADASSATAFAASGGNQFVVRATGGVAINGAPDAVQSELSIRSSSATAGANADLSFYPGAAGRAFRITVGGTAGPMFFYGLDPAAADPVAVRMILANDGDVALNPATPGGGIQANGFPLKVGTSGNTANGNGAHVTNGGVWTNGSSRLFKEAFTAIDAADVLQRVLALPVTRWRYREDAAWHLGPVAEDFRAAFGLGESEQYIGTVDADGVALAAIQGLHARSEARADALARENAALKSSLAALARRVAALEHD